MKAVAIPVDDLGFRANIDLGKIKKGVGYKIDMTF